MKKKITQGLIMVVAVSLAACQSVPQSQDHLQQGMVFANQDHLQQGMVFANQGDFNHAAEEFKRSISIEPSPDAHANLAASYMQLGKRNLAMAELKKAEAMDPGHGMTLYNMTALHALNDDTDLALEYLDRTLSSGFDNYDAIRFDPDLQNLRGEPEFRSTLEKHKVFIQ